MKDIKFMCGIAGILGQADKTNVQTMMKRMTHRGPDAEGVFDDGTGACVLGHTRLSIMDPEGGDQPIYNESSDKVVIANGEIYNFPKLKPDLSKTHTFNTTSDSEAILHLYERGRGRGAQAGIDLYVVKELQGHKSIKMTMRYAHHYPESLRHGVDVLDEIGDTMVTLAQKKGHDIVVTL